MNCCAKPVPYLFGYGQAADFTPIRYFRCRNCGSRWSEARQPRSIEKAYDPSEAIAIERERLAAQALVPPELRECVRMFMDPMTLKQSELYVKLLAQGDHFASTAYLVARIPDHLIAAAAAKLIRVTGSLSVRDANGDYVKVADVRNVQIHWRDDLGLPI